MLYNVQMSISLSWSYDYVNRIIPHKVNNNTSFYSDWTDVGHVLSYYGRYNNVWLKISYTYTSPVTDVIVLGVHVALHTCKNPESSH